MVILQACAYAAEYPGNFFSTLTALENALAEKNIRTIYAFPERAIGKAWCEELQRRTKVYFLPEANARILPETYRIFRKIYAENEVGILHSHFELYDIPATVTAPRNVRVFWHLHDPIGDGFEKSALTRRILTRLQYGWFSHKATLLTVSEKHGDFAASIGFPKKQIVYFPNGINTARIRQVPLYDASQKKLFLMLGWDVFRKGVDMIVNASQRIERDDYAVRIVGLDKCEEYLAEHKAPALHFLRPVTDINMLFQDTFAFLHISRAEGQSYALLEAIYAGLPVICSDIPENQFAQQFRNVYWVKTGDTEYLANRINGILDGAVVPSDEDIFYNRNIIEQKYSISAWVSQTISFYLPDAASE